MGQTNCDSPDNEGGFSDVVEVTVIVPVVGIISIVFGIGIDIGESITVTNERIRFLKRVGCRRWRHRRWWSWWARRSMEGVVVSKVNCPVS